MTILSFGVAATATPAAKVAAAAESVKRLSKIAYLVQFFRRSYLKWIRVSPFSGVTCWSTWINQIRNNRHIYNAHINLQKGGPWLNDSDSICYLLPW